MPRGGVIGQGVQRLQLLRNRRTKGGVQKVNLKLV
jgi:hypothetical protein